jgi:hypothetical protein
MQDPIALPDDFREAIKSAERPLLFLDHAASGERYVLLPLENYVAICMETVPDGFTIEEQQWLLVQAGLRAGWDDPAMDVYNDIEPDDYTRRGIAETEPRS